MCPWRALLGCRVARSSQALGGDGTSICFLADRGSVVTSASVERDTAGNETEGSALRGEDANRPLRGSGAGAGSSFRAGSAAASPPGGTCSGGIRAGGIPVAESPRVSGRSSAVESSPELAGSSQDAPLGQLPVTAATSSPDDRRLAWSVLSSAVGSSDQSDLRRARRTAFPRYPACTRAAARCFTSAESPVTSAGPPLGDISSSCELSHSRCVVMDATEQPTVPVSMLPVLRVVLPFAAADLRAFCLRSKLLTRSFSLGDTVRLGGGRIGPARGEEDPFEKAAMRSAMAGDTARGMATLSLRQIFSILLQSSSNSAHHRGGSGAPHFLPRHVSFR